MCVCACMYKELHVLLIINMNFYATLNIKLFILKNLSPIKLKAKHCRMHFYFYFFQVIATIFSFIFNSFIYTKKKKSSVEFHLLRNWKKKKCASRNSTLCVFLSKFRELIFYERQQQNIYSPLMYVCSFFFFLHLLNV